MQNVQLFSAQIFVLMDKKMQHKIVGLGVEDRTRRKRTRDVIMADVRAIIIMQKSSIIIVL